jgi:hypothetical protein
MPGPEDGGDATTFPAFRAGFLLLLLQPAECYSLTDASLHFTKQAMHMLFGFRQPQPCPF